jgi:hypothetical protein
MAAPKTNHSGAAHSSAPAGQASRLVLRLAIRWQSAFAAAPAWQSHHKCDHPRAERPARGGEPFVAFQHDGELGNAEPTNEEERSGAEFGGIGVSSDRPLSVKDIAAHLLPSSRFGQHRTELQDGKQLLTAI